MNFIDATKRPLKVPVKFIPYLEKHNIYDLFYNLGSSIVIKKPDNILQFMKDEILRFEDLSVRQRQIIFIAPPHIDIVSLAVELASNCSINEIHLEDVVRNYNLQQNSEEPRLNPVELAQATLNFIKRKRHECGLNGWILIGYPQTKDEARALQRLGIFPTHTFQITHDPNEYKEKDFWNENLSNDWTYEDLSKMMKDYKRRAIGLRQAFASTLKTIVVRGRTMLELKNDILSNLLKFQCRGMPFSARVVLLGMRGSRRRTLAKMLSDRLKLVHIHFWDLIAQAKQRDKEIGYKIKEPSGLYRGINISMDILENRLLSDDCLERGWVLTGFPFDENDFKDLDGLSTPPNKIVFLEIPQEICYNRLQDRCINMYTGEVLSRTKIADNDLLKKQTKTHPQDSQFVVCQEQKEYLAEYNGLVEYKWDKAIFLDGRGSLLEVFERIENIIVNPTQPLHQSIKPHTSLSLHVFSGFRSISRSSQFSSSFSTS